MDTDLKDNHEVILHPSGEDEDAWGSKGKTWLGLLDLYIYQVQFKRQAFTLRNTIVLYTVGSTSTSISPRIPMQGPLVSALPLHTDAMLLPLYCCLIWFGNGLDGVSVAWKCYSVCLCVDGEDGETTALLPQHDASPPTELAVIHWLSADWLLTSAHMTVTLHDVKVSLIPRLLSYDYTLAHTVSLFLSLCHHSFSSPQACRHKHSQTHKDVHTDADWCCNLL